MPAVPHAYAGAPGQSRRQQKLDVFFERAILGVIVLILLCGPLAFGGVPEGAFVVIQGLTVLALGLWMARIWAQGSLPLLWPPTCWAALVFLLYALARCPLAPIEYPAQMEMNQVIVYASLFFIAVNNLTRRESVTVIVVCLVTLGMVLSWHAVYQFATKAPRVWGFPRRDQYIGRGTATYLNPNHLAGLLEMTFALAFAYTLMSRLSPTVKVLFAYGALSMLAGIGASLSRGGMIAIAVTVVVFCLVLLFQRGYWIVGLGLLIALIVLFVSLSSQFALLQKRFDQSFHDGEVKDARVDYWPAAIHLFEDQPWWGIGPGNFDSDFARYRPRTVQIRPVYAHNDYLNTLAEWGAAGMAVILGFCGLLYYGAFRTWPALQKSDIETGEVLRSDKSAFLMGACIALVAILFHSVVDFNMHVPANAIVVITLAALITNHWRFATERFWRNPRLPGKILLTAVLVAVMAWLAAQGVRSGREAYWQHQAGDEKASWNDRLTGLKMASAAEPSNFANSYNLGEYYRLTSLEGKPGYEADAREAIKWYAKSMVSNPFDAFVPMRYGMCLDWIGQTNEATPYFAAAEKLDPNNMMVAYYYGRHCVNLGDYAAARHWFEHSIQAQFTDIAFWALEDLKQRLAEPYGLYKK